MRQPMAETTTLFFSVSPLTVSGLNSVLYFIATTFQFFRVFPAFLSTDKILASARYKKRSNPWFKTGWTSDFCRIPRSLAYIVSCRSFESLRFSSGESCFFITL